MNIELLRRAQASILNPNTRFDMGDWTCCIAGHILGAAGEPVSLLQVLHEASNIPTSAIIAADAGEFGQELRDLFSNYLSWEHRDRVAAVAGLERLIDMALESAQAAPLCSPALEPCAQRAAARAGEQEEQEQQAEEELELVGA